VGPKRPPGHTRDGAGDQADWGDADASPTEGPPGPLLLVSDGAVNCVHLVDVVAGRHLVDVVAGRHVGYVGEQGPGGGAHRCGRLGL
jgi:hypothetical protein